MPARNDITGDSIASRGSNEAYRNNWGKIFGEKSEDNSETEDDKDEEE